MPDMPMGGMPPNRPPMKPPMKPGGDPIKDNYSMMNPADLAAMGQEGGFSPDMTVRDVMSKLGIDVEGPASQLFEFGKKQTQNASALGKMKNIASSQNAPPPQPMPSGGGQGDPGGLDSLLNKV